MIFPVPNQPRPSIGAILKVSDDNDHRSIDHKRP
jgi:hypothetical protein